MYLLNFFHHHLIFSSPPCSHNVWQWGNESWGIMFSGRKWAAEMNCSYDVERVQRWEVVCLIHMWKEDRCGDALWQRGKVKSEGRKSTMIKVESRWMKDQYFSDTGFFCSIEKWFKCWNLNLITLASCRDDSWIRGSKEEWNHDRNITYIVSAKNTKTHFMDCSLRSNAQLVKYINKNRLFQYFSLPLSL